MPRMLCRALCLTLLALVCAPSAQAAIADRYVPAYDASVGVTVGESIHFAPKAAAIYKRIAGRRALVGCGDIEATSIGDGLSSSGYGSSIVTIPRRRGPVRMLD